MLITIVIAKEGFMENIKLNALTEEQLENFYNSFEDLKNGNSEINELCDMCDWGCDSGCNCDWVCDDGNQD